MLASSTPLPLLDALGVPYDARAEVAPPAPGLHAIAWLEDGIPARTLSWPVETPSRRVVPDAAQQAIRRDEAGDILLPFDPVLAMRAMLTEGYRTESGSARNPRARAAAAYYRLRPAIPRRLQIALRRVASRAQSSAPFPAWPIEPALHDLYDLMLGLLAALAGRPLPYVAPWPAPYSWAFVLTHDVETRAGCANIDRVLAVERDFGVRSSWNFVPRRYEVDDALVRRLRDDGHEVGVHGLRHDGRDLASRAVLERRLPAIREAARRWDAAGFRAPALRRSYDLMPLLGFDYDSSYPDTDPHGPDGGGCCSWLPFMIDDLVELPVTLPQDHTLFEILRHRDGALWLEKARYLRRRGGMALLITHPDYLLDDERLRAYRGLLEAFAGDETAWRPLPREVSAWWRRRAASRIVPAEGGWRLEGPAADEARVAYALPWPATDRVPADPLQVA